MAVYTKVTDGELVEFLQAYDVGEPRQFIGIADGVENSNFYLQTDQSRYILTLYEKRVSEDDLPFFISLMRHLVEKGMPTASPIADKQGQFLRRLNDRPAAIINFLEGTAKTNPSDVDCSACGTALARLQLATSDFRQYRKNTLSLAGWQALADKCGSGADKCKPGLSNYIKHEIEFLNQHWPEPGSLPCGVVHTDLFPDNVLFTNSTITGIIDFYFACTDFYAYDLAICLNAWAFNESHVFQSLQAREFLRAYESIRPLTFAEKQQMHVFLRGAALRFLLTRLYDWLNQEPGALVKVKDPLEYLAKLRFHQSTQIMDHLND